MRRAVPATCVMFKRSAAADRLDGGGGGGSATAAVACVYFVAIGTTAFRWRRRRRRALRRRDPRRVFSLSLSLFHRSMGWSNPGRFARGLVDASLFSTCLCRTKERGRRRVTNCISKFCDSRPGDSNSPLPADHLSSGWV